MHSVAYFACLQGKFSHRMSGFSECCVLKYWERLLKKLKLMMSLCRRLWQEQIKVVQRNSGWTVLSNQPSSWCYLFELRERDWMGATFVCGYINDAILLCRRTRQLCTIWLYFLRSMEGLPEEIENIFRNGKPLIWHITGVWNAIWSDMFIGTTFMRCGHRLGGGVSRNNTMSPGSKAMVSKFAHM